MSPRGLASRIARWSDGPEQSTRPVALMRIAIGLIVLARFGSELALFRSLDPVSLVLGPLFFLLAAMMVVGYMARLATAGVAAAIVEIYLTGGYGNTVHQWNHHHVYILMSAAILLAFTPCDRSYSVDRYRALREAEQGGPPAPPERGNLWAQRLIVLQLGALYFWTAYDKSDWAWMSGQRLEQLFAWVYSGRPLERVLDWPVLLAALSVGVLGIEYALAVGVFVRRWHPVILPTGLALHGAFYVLLPVETYSVTMMALYLALPDPDAIHRVLDKMQGHASAPHRL